MRAAADGSWAAPRVFSAEFDYDLFFLVSSKLRKWAMSSASLAKLSISNVALVGLWPVHKTITMLAIKAM